MSDCFLEALPEQREWRIIVDAVRGHVNKRIVERENLPVAIDNLGSTTRPKGAARNPAPKTSKRHANR